MVKKLSHADQIDTEYSITKSDYDPFHKNTPLSCSSQNESSLNNNPLRNNRLGFYCRNESFPKIR